jgi:omega-amidase
MQNLKVTLVQCEQVWEDKAKNLAHFEELLKDIQETDLIILPEMFHTSFSMNASELAEEMHDSMGIKWLKNQALSKNTAIYTSLIIHENGHYFNRGIFVFPSGEFETYDKIKLFSLAGEDTVFTPGKAPKIVNYKGWNFMMQICYDLRFPEICRNKIDLPNQQPFYDVLLYVANWPTRRDLHWRTLLQARAIENQSYVIGVNRVGEDGNQLNYCGSSMCVSALGEIQLVNSSGFEQLVTVELVKEDLNEIRMKIPFLKDYKC